MSCDLELENYMYLVTQFFKLFNYICVVCNREVTFIVVYLDDITRLNISCTTVVYTSNITMYKIICTGLFIN